MARDKAKDATADQEVEKPAPKPKKKGGKLKLLLMLIVPLLAIVGGAAWFFLDGESTPEEAAKAKAQEESHKTPIFVTLEPFTVNLQPDGGERYLQVGIDLKVADQKVVDSVKLHMPEIRNGILLLLSSKHVAEISGVDGKQKLSVDILAQANKPLQVKAPGQGVVGVYFTSFVIQ